jgi:hypothetical protein
VEKTPSFMRVEIVGIGKGIDSVGSGLIPVLFQECILFALQLLRHRQNRKQTMRTLPLIQFIRGVLAVTALLTAGCGTPVATQWPEVDRISQRDQITETARDISNSPYVR